MNTTQPIDAHTLSASDIAQLAGVGRSTVSNWRQRHEDFPAPVSGQGNRVRYSAAEVHAWLKSQGKEIQTLTGGRVLWNIFDQWRGSITLEDAGSMISDLITWRFVSDPTSPGFEKELSAQAYWPTVMKSDQSNTWKQISAGMETYESAHQGMGPMFATLGHAGHEDLQNRFSEEFLLPVLEAVNSLESTELYSTFVSLHDRITRTGMRGYDPSATSDTLVELMATLAADIPGPVHDPVVGSGRMLVAAASLGEGRSALSGQDIISRTSIHAKQRALLAGCENIDIREGDVFKESLFAPGTAQVVVMDPPYGLHWSDGVDLYLDPRLIYGTPPRSTADLAWLQVALWHLGQHGRAFVLQPPGSAFRGGAERAIRTAMLRAGTVEAVIALPAGLASHTQIPLNLWVLARPGETADPNRVLMVDHSTTADINAADIAEVLKQWREQQTVSSNLHAADFTITELLAQEANLDPHRWMRVTEGVADVEDVRAAVEAVNSAIANFRPLKLTPGVITEANEPPRIVTVAELEKADALTVLRATPKIRQADLEYSDNGTPIITGPWIRGNGELQMIDLSSLEEQPLITHSGDVLVQNTGGLAARVDREGGKAVVSSSFHLLRTKGETIDPEYLAEFLVSIQNRNQAQGVSIQRIRLADMVIRMIPREQQERLVGAISDLRAIQTAAQQVLTATDAACQHIIDAVTEGNVDID